MIFSRGAALHRLGASEFNEHGEQDVQRRVLGTITGPWAWLPSSC